MNNDSPWFLNIKIYDFFKKKNLFGGFYIEAGASNGLWQNNTFLLEQEMFWTGLLVEPNEEMFKKCKTNRPNNIVENYALVDDKYKEEFVKLFSSNIDYGLSLSGKINYKNNQNLNKRNINFDLKKGAEWQTVPAITLQKLIQKNNIRRKIDFLSLDVEGVELIVLDGLNLKNNKPRFLLLEITTEKRKIKTETYLKKHGFNLIEQMTPNDYLFEEER